MFGTWYKELMRRFRLSERFKADLVDQLLEGPAPVPYARLVLVAAAALLVVTVTVGLIANTASNGKLYYALFGGQDPRTTDMTTLITGTASLTTVMETSSASITESSDVITPKSTDESVPSSSAGTVGPTTESTPSTSGPAAGTDTSATFTPQPRIAPVVRAIAGESTVTVSWDAIDSSELIGYRVVASVGNSDPVYDKDGYFLWITDRTVTSCTIKSGDPYWGGDVGVFYGGIDYHFSVTAIYGDDRQAIAGNSVMVTMPGGSAIPACLPAEPVNLAPIIDP